MRRARTTALCVILAALLATPVAAADVTPPPPPCAASGLVAIVRPDATSAVTLGPAVSAATTQGASVDTFHDAQYTVDLTTGEAGAAGCVASGGPGGTHAMASAWSVLGDALAGSGLRADLVPAGGDGSGWHLRTQIKGLRVAGSATEPIDGATVAVGGWGTLTIGAQIELPRLQPLRWWAAALVLRVAHAHAGLPAGTLVFVGYAAANRAPAPPPAPTPTPTTTQLTTTGPTRTTPPTTTAPTKTAPVTTTAKPRPSKHTPKPKPKPAVKKHKPRHRAKPRTGLPLTGTPPLRVGGDLFPVAGGADWGDTYGGERSDVPGGWHHGDDLFAPLGTPVVAVADGTVFAVGWNEVGGWRLWLTDDAGNGFYYAHLSGYTKLAQDNHTVHRGDVLGFVGNTGDAFTTDPHLHFEVHPNGLLYLGYDGAVDPTSYLRSWPLAQHVHVLPPVELPGVAPTGFGSATDFRQLLAVHPLPANPHPAAKPPRSNQPAVPERPSNLVGARVVGTRAPGGGSSLPVVFAIVLLAGGLAAVAHSARDGRT
ncbi:MAG: M23 family metallopeptidase [Gaiellaceae bacterium]